MMRAAYWRGLLLRDFLIILWFLAWVSTPDSVAMASASEISGYAIVKVLLRSVIAGLVCIPMFLQWPRVKYRFGDVLVLPLVFVAWNVVTLPLSSDVFYSSFRLFEFVLIWMTALLFIEWDNQFLNARARLRRFFGISGIVCLVLVVFHFFLPEWGGKISGIDPISGETMSRLGGSVLRVDLAAALGGCVFVFWVFSSRKNYSVKERWFGILTGGAVLVLAHSRTIIYLVLILFVMSMFSKRSRGSGTFALVCLSGLIVLSTNAFYSFLLRGTEVSEIYQLSGRLDLWAAAFAENTWKTVVLGNGYLMNSPKGLEFYVMEMGRRMDSPHNGYVSILLGSGVIGLLLVVLMYVSYWKRIFKIKQPTNVYMRNSLIFLFLFLAALTMMDFGAWGVTSPSMLIFSVIYLVTFNIVRRERI